MNVNQARINVLKAQAAFYDRHRCDCANVHQLTDDLIRAVRELVAAEIEADRDFSQGSTMIRAIRLQDQARAMNIARGE